MRADFFMYSLLCDQAAAWDGVHAKKFGDVEFKIMPISTCLTLSLIMLRTNRAV